MSSTSPSPSPSAAAATTTAPAPVRENAHSLVGSGSGSVEAMRALLCGLLFGVTAPIVGQPIDLVKTRMQVGGRFAKTSAFETFRITLKNEGVLGLYKGILPPLFGSTIFRSVQFTAYGFAFGASKDSEFLRQEVPGLGGMQLRVITSGLFSSTVRSLIETPLEFIKVRKQLDQPWRVHATVGESLRNPLKEVINLYNGLGMCWARTVGLMTSFFMMVDSLERHAPELISIPVFGPFIKGGGCATAGWLIVWPFENLKNQVQAGAGSDLPAGTSTTERVRHILKNRGGFLGLYRGVGPGLLRSLMANGASMVVFSKCQEGMRALAAKQQKAEEEASGGGHHHHHRHHHHHHNASNQEGQNSNSSMK